MSAPFYPKVFHVVILTCTKWVYANGFHSSIFKLEKKENYFFSHLIFLIIRHAFYSKAWFDIHTTFSPRIGCQTVVSFGGSKMYFKDNCFKFYYDFFYVKTVKLFLFAKHCVHRSVSFLSSEAITGRACNLNFDQNFELEISLN